MDMQNKENKSGSEIVNPVNRIKSQLDSERPRRRLLEEGAQVLTDAELVAILLRSGSKSKDVVSFARELLAGVGGLRGLLSSSSKNLAKLKGMGEAKISSILVIHEILKRNLRAEIVGKNIIRDPQSVIEYLYCSMRDRKREVFKVLFLNKANRILSDEDLFEGTVDEAAIYMRDLVGAALENSASSLVICHNHPSGRTLPSQEDIHLTRKIRDACEPIGIKLMDHLIIGDNQYYSFNAARLLDFPLASNF